MGSTVTLKVFTYMQYDTKKPLHITFTFTFVKCLEYVKQTSQGFIHIPKLLSLAGEYGQQNFILLAL